MECVKEEILRDRREGRAATIFVTGATGFLGAHLAVELLERGYRLVLLCRSNSGLNAAARFEQILDWFSPPRRPSFRYTVIGGDIRRPRLGLASSAFRALAGEVTEIFHCAADTSFVDRNRNRVEEVNVESLNHLLEFADAGRCDFFHHLSTVYVAGKKAGRCVESITDQTQFHNVYESSKHRGEMLLKRECDKLGIRLNIYRPSIVYGDSRTGKSLRFNALYFPIKLATQLKELFLKDRERPGGGRAESLGIKFLKDGSLYFPLRLQTARDGELNIIPVDYFSNVTLHLFENALGGGVFHIVAPRGESMRTVIGHAAAYLGLSGVETVTSEVFGSRPRNSLEHLFERYTEAYRPYMSDRRRFSMMNTRRFLNDSMADCPEFSYTVFSRCMDYANAVNWGKRLFS
jgi:nucleoside-diphosphate-sugar epimerase